jgi:uncharacterized protein YcfJ
MKYLILVLTTLVLSACAVEPQKVPTTALDSGPNIVRLNGEITDIRLVQKKASFGKRFGASFAGALIGGQIGGGKASDAASLGGAFLGAELADKKYGEVIDHVFIAGEDGQSYDTFVQDHVFRVGDKVQFTIVSGHISAIVMRK